MNERVTMWSSQTPEVLNIIRRDGVSTVKRAYIRKKYGETAWIFLEAYDFMNGALRRKVPQPEGADITMKSGFVFIKPCVFVSLCEIIRKTSAVARRS